MSEQQFAIKAENISKTFQIPHEKIDTMRGAFVNIYKKKKYETFKALDDVSFEVKKGEFFGIIGRNGSGKSTLLKIIASIYQADKGKMEINGRISPFLELGIGFSPELSGRDNIYLNGTVLGMTHKQIEEKFDDIVKFSELEKFIDQKLKNYSSGMSVRLAFSVAIHANREILLMDEVLAVGDTNFQQKCLEEFNRYKEQGRTVILVSHDIGTIRRYCQRALLLKKGKINSIGRAQQVVDDYINQNISDAENREDNIYGSQELESKNQKKVEITNVDFLDKNLNNKKVFKAGEPIIARIFFDARQELENAVFGVGIYTQDDIYLLGPNTKNSGFNIEKLAGKGYIDFELKNNLLVRGKYRFTAAIYDWNCVIPYDYKDKQYGFTVAGGREEQHGLIVTDHQWKIH